MPAIEPAVRAAVETILSAAWRTVQEAHTFEFRRRLAEAYFPNGAPEFLDRVAEELAERRGPTGG